MWCEAVRLVEITEQTSRGRSDAPGLRPGSLQCLEFRRVGGAGQKRQRRHNQGGRREGGVEAR